MSLEELYNNASNGTYVGKVKATQVNDVGAGPSDSFFDGGRKTQKTLANQDVFQTEFTRNAAGTNANGGAQGTVPLSNDKSYQSSRWTSKALKLPFEGEGPASLNKGYYENTRFRAAITPKGITPVHNYTPLPDGGYLNKNASAGLRYNSPATSPIGEAGGGTTGGTTGGTKTGKR